MILTNLTAYTGFTAPILFDSKKDVFSWFDDPNASTESRKTDSIMLKVLNDAYAGIGIQKDSEIPVHTMVVGYTGKKNENNKLLDYNGKHMIYDNTDVDGKFKIVFIKDCTDPLNNKAPKFYFNGIFKRNGTTASGMKVYTRVSDTICKDNFSYIEPVEEIEE